MDLEAWTRKRVDGERRKRLAFGAGLGTLLISSTALAIALNSKGVEEIDTEEDVMEVQLAKEPEPDVQPEPEPEPEPVHQNPTPRPAGPVMPKLSTPTEIPDDAPQEQEVDPNANPYASSDPYQFGAGQAGTGPRTTVAVKAEAPKPVAIERPTGPVRLTADTTPPGVLSAGPSVYPADAKAAGIEGKVVVKVVVDEGGVPTSVKAVKGPDVLKAACEERWRQTKFSPALREGKPVAIQLVKICSYKLKT